MGSMIKNARFNRKQATQAYNAIYLVSMKCGLPEASFSHKTIESIHRYAVNKFLSSMGYDRSTYWALLLGSRDYGGFGVRQLYTEMQGMKLESMISHIRAKTVLGNHTG
jgi:hypothetical protein